MSAEDHSLVRLKHTLVKSTQLQHPPSSQRTSVSEQVYSPSGPTPSEADRHSRLSAFNFFPPSSREPSPPLSNDQLSPVQPAPSVNLTTARRASLPIRKNPGTVAFDESTIMQLYRPEPSLTGIPDRRRTVDSFSPATTPGVDSTPYIRFAIDQLTRDEEVRGSRHYPGALPDVREDSEESYPVERIISNEGLTYSPHHSLQLQPPPQRPLPILPTSTQVDPLGGPTQREETTSALKDVFVPHYPPSDSLLQPPLDFVPAILRPFPLIIFLLVCGLMVAGLIFSVLRSRAHSGFVRYHEFGGPFYFVFQYLPTLLGMLILIWLFQVETALQRIAPFIALSNESQRARSRALFLDISPRGFFLPNFQYFINGHPLFGICSLIFWLSLFTIPLLASCFNVRYRGIAGHGEWRWVAVQNVIWTTVGLYVLLMLAITLLIITLSCKQTGLKWDPRSLADIICLIERSNIAKDFEGSETFSRKDFRQKLSGRANRLGYWHASKRPTDIFYTLGQPGGATRSYRGNERGVSDGEDDSRSSGRYTIDFSIRMDIRSSRIRLKYLPWYLVDSAVVAWVVISVVLLLAFLILSFLNNAIRDGFMPMVSAATDPSGFSLSNFLYSFMPAAVGMLLFLSWQSLDLTFRALQPYGSLATRDGATAEQSLLADYPARLPVSVSVIAAANGHYRVAALSLMALVNISIPVLAGGIFWTQFYSKTWTIRVAAHLPGFYALCFFLTLYALATLIILPGRRRIALPHAPWNLAEIISFLYQSPIVTDRAFARPPTKAELVTRLMGTGWTDRSTFSRSLTSLVTPSKRNLSLTATKPDPDKASAFLTVDQPDKGKEREEIEKRRSTVAPDSILYGFGVYLGRNGREHLGIDRLRRPIGRDMVIHEAQRRSWISRV